MISEGPQSITAYKCSWFDSRLFRGDHQITESSLAYCDLRPPLPGKDLQHSNFMVDIRVYFTSTPFVP